MAEHQAALTECNTQVLVVSFGDAARVAAFQEHLGLPFPIAADPERHAYRAYGMLRGSAWSIWHPRTLWRYARLWIRGRRSERATEGDDLHQLGGDFLIDANGIVRFCHQSRRPDDRPTAAEILAAITHARGAASVRSTEKSGPW